MKTYPIVPFKTSTRISILLRMDSGHPNLCQSWLYPMIILHKLTNKKTVKSEMVLIYESHDLFRLQIPLNHPL